MRRFVPSVQRLVVALLISNLLAIAAEAFIRWKMGRPGEEPLVRGSELPTPTGVAPSGALWHEDPETARPCHVVRFASRHCPACAPAQSGGYVLLARTLAARGCDLIVLSPSGSDLPLALVDPGPPAQEMRAVDLRFVAASGFTATPTTVVLDRNWRVLWSALGAFNEVFARAGLRAIP